MLQVSLKSIVLLVLLDGYSSEKVASVKAHAGTIIGATKTVAFQQKKYEVNSYLGIPYAKPPVGELRFKKPELLDVFEEPYSASKFGPSCPQPISPMLNMGADVQSENCLFLNVFVPQQPSDMEAGHAVMVFIHGGGLTMGNGDLYNGEVLASIGNVIIVTINYRLGLLGFLNTDDEHSKGNFGLWDQRFAFQWVNKNIGAFGGDKERVTIFGQSGGSFSVAVQMLYPENKNLFRGGITQSGSLTIPSAIQENHVETAKYFAENMSCSVETMDEVFNCLKSATSEAIAKVVTDTMASMDMTSMMKIATTATVDGDLIKETATELYKKAETGTSPEIDFFRSLKLINGINGQEGAMYLQMLGADNLEDIEISREQMNTEQLPGATALAYGAKELPEAVKQILISAYTDWTNPDDPKTIREQVSRLYGDIYFNVPGIEMSRVHCNASHVDSYIYNFVAALDKRLMPTPSWIKSANHGEELAPVFGYNFDLETLLNITDYSPPEWELDMSKRMMTYWSNFAKTGNPNQPASDDISALNWPKYDMSSQAFIKFDREDSTGNYLYARETDLWKNVIPKVLDATEHAESITSQYGKKAPETCEQGGNC